MTKNRERTIGLWNFSQRRRNFVFKERVHEPYQNGNRQNKYDHFGCLTWILQTHKDHTQLNQFDFMPAEKTVTLT